MNPYLVFTKYNVYNANISFHKGDIMIRKVYVGVRANVDLEGNITPISIKWDDGRVFEIDRIIDKPHQAVSQAAGGNGIRFDCEIKGKVVPLYFEHLYKVSRWFMEGKDKAPEKPVKS